MSGKKFRSLGFAAIAMVSCLVAGSALAQASRTWVSGVGDDANPCSRTAPCKTFAGAISKTAAGGEIDALDPAGYGAVTITKAITIDGGAGQVASVLVSGTNGIVVQAGPGDVVRLRNLSINGIGTGINGVRFLAGNALEMRNVHIFGFTAQGISFEPGAGTTSVLTVSDTVLENNAGGGVWITGAGSAVASLTRVTMSRSQRGLRAEDGAIVHVKDSSAIGNTGNGFIAAATSRPVLVTLDHCVAFSNANAGIFAGNFGSFVISDNTITSNGTGLMLAGGAIISSGNNTVQGNTTNGSPSAIPGRT